MEPIQQSTAGLYLFTALSLSIGWGIRGNFGHEFGAMIPGALSAMAAVLLSGREDWRRRIGYFAFFGALGWSFGGSISYMQVIAYTHSGHSSSVLYGFACLFLIGFIWAAVGGAGIALPAVLDRDRLTEFFPPLTVVFVAWLLQDAAEAWLVAVPPDYRHESPLYWYDTDWLAALLAVAAVLVLAALRRRLDSASSLILHMAVGWWVGFLLLVVLLGWRMTPPRGDNWAGALGMVGGMLVFFLRRRWTSLVFASLLTGLIGGFGFSTATLFKLVEIKSGWQTNWHSVLEQTYGFINGLGVAVVMRILAGRCPPSHDEPPIRRWTEVYAVAFVLVGVTYLNLRKNPADWVKAGTVPGALAGLSAGAWFDLAYLALALALVGLLCRHVRRPLACVPPGWLGKGQLLYLLFLWWIVIGNFERALVAFAPQRLVTEGVIHLNAVACTLIVLLAPVQLGRAGPASASPLPLFSPIIKRTLVAGVVGMALSVLADWGIVRALYGDQFAGYAGRHIRFGPNATAVSRPPARGQPHP